MVRTKHQADGPPSGGSWNGTSGDGSRTRRHRPIVAWRTRRRPALLLSASLAVLVVAAVACSSNSSPTTTTNPTTPAAGSPAATSPPAGGSSSALTGRWNGTYSGTFNGSFKLSWNQSGSTLTGIIHLNPGGLAHINGTVSGNSIRFGTVGSTEITYTGTVSGNSMSGTWKVHAGAGGSGNWSATKA